MTGTYNIYCDESTHLENDHQLFMLFGYVQIAYNELRIAKEQIKEIRRKYNYTDEFKWTNIHESTFKVYDELIEYFFSTNMEFRCVIVDKSQINSNDIITMTSTSKCISNCCITCAIWMTTTTFIWI